VFGFTFLSEGTYVFVGNGTSVTPRVIVVVMPSGQVCPSGTKILATTSSNLMDLGVFSKRDVVTEPSVYLVIVIIIVYTTVSVMLFTFTRLKIDRARATKFGTKTTLPDSSEHFKELYFQLKQQKKSHDEMFKRQKDTFQSQCQRISAESEQIKALLGVKLTDGRGFVEAALSLVLAEITARDSYEGRMKRREGDIIVSFKTLQTKISIDPQKMNVANIIESVGELMKEITVLDELCAVERNRRDQLAANSGIIGEEVVHELCAHQHEEETAEDHFLDLLLAFKGDLAIYQEKLTILRLDLDERERSTNGIVLYMFFRVHCLHVFMSCTYHHIM
jgi:hypothetical protein